jgi:hypothetical protein
MVELDLSCQTGREKSTELKEQKGNYEMPDGTHPRNHQAQLSVSR